MLCASTVESVGRVLNAHATQFHSFNRKFAPGPDL